LWEAGKIETVVRYFSSHPKIDVVFTNGFIMLETTKTAVTCFDKTNFSPALRAEFHSPLPLLKHLLTKRNLATGATMAIRGNAIADHIPFVANDLYLHDYVLALQAAAGGKLGFIDVPLISYRLHKNQQIGFKRHPRILQPGLFIFRSLRDALRSKKTNQQKDAMRLHLLNYCEDRFPEITEFLTR